jgi:hypothetical protein
VPYRRPERIAQLQDLLGDLGRVLPHQPRGSPSRPARGWYADMHKGGVVFLGDHYMLAAIAINKLHEAQR